MFSTIPGDQWPWGEPRRLLEAEALTLGEPNLLGSGGTRDPCSVGSYVFALSDVKFLEGCETSGFDRVQGSSLMGENKADKFYFTICRGRA